jgi:hypothetical protein
MPPRIRSLLTLGCLCASLGVAAPAAAEGADASGLAGTESMRETIGRYLVAVDRRFEALRPVPGLATELQGAPAQPAPQLLATDALGQGGGVPLGLDALGGGFRQPIGPDLELFGGQRRYGVQGLADEPFSEGGRGEDLGLRYSTAAGDLSATLSRDQLQLGAGNALQAQDGVSLQWRRPVGAGSDLTGFLSYSSLRYELTAQSPGEPFADADQRLLGLSWDHSFGGSRAPSLFVSGYVGNAEDRGAPLAPDGDALEAEATPGGVRRDLWGLSAGGAYSVTGNLALRGALTAQYSEYEGLELDPGQPRRDDYYSLSVGADWRLSREWTLRPRLTFARNLSSEPLSEYERAVLELRARWRFE